MPPEACGSSMSWKSGVGLEARRPGSSFMQEGGTAEESFIPPFDLTGISTGPP